MRLHIQNVHPFPKIAELEISHVTLIKGIARGSYSKLHLAYDRETGENIVLKKFRSGPLGSILFSREMEALKLLQQAKQDQKSSFVVGMQWIDVKQNMVALEVCDGGDLFDLISQEPLSQSDAAFYAAEVAVAIGFLHDNNIFHGDVKPENVGITAQGHVRLLDFGLSYILSPEEDVDEFTGRFAIKTNAGTMSYAAPEILKYGQCGLEADWWSFGILLHELLFALIPWEGETKEETAHMITTEPLLWTSEQLQKTSLDAVILLQGLISSKKPKNRLCYEYGLAELKYHAFFSCIDWEKLEQQRLAPPFQPNFVQNS